MPGMRGLFRFVHTCITTSSVLAHNVHRWERLPMPLRCCQATRYAHTPISSFRLMRQTTHSSPPGSLISPCRVCTEKFFRPARSRIRRAATTGATSRNYTCEARPSSTILGVKEWSWSIAAAPGAARRWQVSVAAARRCFFAPSVVACTNVPAVRLPIVHLLADVLLAVLPHVLHNIRTPLTHHPMALTPDSRTGFRARPRTIAW
jgi:hypothetical protein